MTILALAFNFGAWAQSAQSSAPAQQTPPTSQAESPPPPPEAGNAETRQPPIGLLTPITEEGGLPPLFHKMYELSAEELAYRAKVRDYAKQIRKIRHKHLGDMKVRKIRDAGIEELKEFTDPAAFRPLIEELAREQDDVRLAMLDHFAQQGDAGQAALAWVVIHDPAKDAAIRNEALRGMTTPVSEPVLVVLDGALRSKDSDVLNAAAVLASSLHIVQAIPHLIFAQAAAEQPENESQGDLAWIAIQTQRAYVAGLVPVAGNNVGAFQPIISTINEGTIMRVVDAVVIEYRTIVHRSLVAMTSQEWGQSTEYLGYNIQAWWDWYNNQFVPFKNEQIAKAALEQPQ